jgi:hypothetical protein
LEFLFPQTVFDLASDPASTGTAATILGFAALAIGRHLVPWRDRSPIAAFGEVRPNHIFLLFVLAAGLGYLHILLAVNFDVLEMLRQMSLPRFSQSWGRGRYGASFYELLVEVGALIYLIPPVAGVIYARASQYSAVQKVIITIILMVTIYSAFASGTRNIIAIYIFTLFGAYFLTKPRITLRTVLFQGIVILIILLVTTAYMLAFRDVGLTNFSFSKNNPDTLYIDHNMVVISQLTDVFPQQYGFLGWEIPYNILIHPIYMAGGMLGVMIAGLLLGAAGEMWNRVGRQPGSTFAQLLYASGFLCAASTMRSLLWISVTILPTVALWLYGKLWLGRPLVQRSLRAARLNKFQGR